MERTLVSIIIPMYNSEKYIEECIESVVKQTISNIEIIIIDDNSNDNSYNICKRYAEVDDRIILIHNKENKGVATARNIGISKATGEYIGFVDSDDIIEKDMYEYLVAQIKENNSDISICGYSKNISTNNSYKEEFIFNQKEALLDFIKEEHVTGYLWDKLIRKELFEADMFPQNISISEDKYVLWKILKKVSTVSFGSKICYHYIQHKNSLCNSKLSSKRLDIYKVNKYIYNDAKNIFNGQNDSIEVKYVELAIRTMIEMATGNFEDDKVINDIVNCMKKVKVKNILKINRKSWKLYGILLKYNYKILRKRFKIKAKRS